MGGKQAFNQFTSMRRCAQTQTYLLNLVVTVEKRRIRGVVRDTDSSDLNIHSFIHSKNIYEHFLGSRHHAKPWRYTSRILPTTCLLSGAYVRLVGGVRVRDGQGEGERWAG